VAIDPAPEIPTRKPHRPFDDDTDTIGRGHRRAERRVCEGRT
jgi:hypothetical protein